MKVIIVHNPQFGLQDLLDVVKMYRELMPLLEEVSSHLPEFKELQQVYMEMEEHVAALTKSMGNQELH